MAKAKAKTREVAPVVLGIEVEDPVGVEWYGKARDAWDEAVAKADEDEAAIIHYEPPPLPSWGKTKHVKREVLGRFLEDRATGVLHDVAAAKAECAVDRIANGTFYHFASEVPQGLPHCPECMG